MSTQPQRHHQPGFTPEWTLGWRLRRARALTGLSTRDFAAEIGTSQKTVTDAENDNRVPRRPVIAAYAMRTGVDLDWLLTGSMQKTPGPDGPGVSNGRPRRDSNAQPTGCASREDGLAELLEFPYWSTRELDEEYAKAS